MWQLKTMLNWTEKYPGEKAGRDQTAADRDQVYLEWQDLSPGTTDLPPESEDYRRQRRVGT